MERAIATSNTTTTAVPTIRETRAALGMGLFLLALTAAFLALFILYGSIRGAAAVWPPFGAPSLPLSLPAVGTAVLLLSIFTVRRSVRSLARGRTASHGWFLLFTANAGALFLLLQVMFARNAMELGIVAGRSLYGSLLYALGGFHAVHVLVGVLALAVLSLSNPAKRAPNLTRARLWSLYWQFLSLIWVGMFVFVFVY